MKIVKELLQNLQVGQVDEKIEKLKAYREMILDWNEKVNMTAITDLDEFEIKHYADSIMVAESLEFQGATRIVDLGTGGGFPGVPLAIIYPEKDFFLVDSLRKRMDIVSQLCQTLSINNVETYHGRAEEVGRMKGYREGFDLCLSRAVANLSTLSEYCLPLVRVGGWFISYKGDKAEEEIKAGEKAIKALGGKLEKYVKPRLPEEFRKYDTDHYLVYINKISKTPAKYPRKAGTPSKEPIK